MSILDLFQPKRVKLVIVKRDQCRLTLEEWRSDPSLTKLARRFLDDPAFRLMVDVLRTSHFIHYQLNVTGVSLEDRAAMQARGEGYTACLANLEAMGDYSGITEKVEETFEEAETEK